jgi:CRISPR/Cas system-associated protein Csm6
LKFKVLRSSRLRSSILQDNISEIGKIKTFEKEVNLNADKKRFWLGDIVSINSRIMNDFLQGLEGENAQK